MMRLAKADGDFRPIRLLREFDLPASVLTRGEPPEDAPRQRREQHPEHHPEQSTAVRRIIVYNAWSIVETATDRDLALWAEDSLPIASRIALSLQPVLDLPEEATLKFMAKYERQRRAKRTERIWWIVGIVAASILSPIVVAAVKAWAGID